MLQNYLSYSQFTEPHLDILQSKVYYDTIPLPPSKTYSGKMLSSSSFSFFKTNLAHLIKIAITCPVFEQGQQDFAR